MKDAPGSKVRALVEFEVAEGGTYKVGCHEFSAADVYEHTEVQEVIPPPEWLAGDVVMVFNPDRAYSRHTDSLWYSCQDGIKAGWDDEMMTRMAAGETVGVHWRGRAIIRQGKAVG